MNSKNNRKIRTVSINDRGQLVIPEDIRNDFGIKGNSTLVMIKKDNELVIKKEAEILDTIEKEDSFWKAISRESLKGAWGKEDEIWNEIAKKSLRAKKNEPARLNLG